MEEINLTFSKGYPDEKTKRTINITEIYAGIPFEVFALKKEAIALSRGLMVSFIFCTAMAILKIIIQGKRG